MKGKLQFTSRIAIGFMLFALFFGAGNLIFPAQLGQEAGSHLWPATIGFLITGVGLPLLGVLAIGYSGANNLQDLASRVHPVYGVAFTVLLYLTIGPFFAAPRTGTVAYEIGIAPFMGKMSEQVGLLIFTFIFFVVVLIFSLYPARFVDNIGKILSPSLVLLLGILLLTAVFKPMGPIQAPHSGYEQFAFYQGFLEGYQTMDALASLVFGMIIITAIRSFGIERKERLFGEVAKSGILATILLGIIYVGIAYLGAMSTSVLGVFDQGGPVLSGAAKHYFGVLGLGILAIVIILACLTTAIGLISANAEYFHTLIPTVSYRWFVWFFTLLTFIVANFGLSNIITFSVPILMFLYPLAIVLMLLAFVAPFFNQAKLVYQATIAVTFLISIVDGFAALYDSLEVTYPTVLKKVLTFYDWFLPLYQEGLGWLLPSIVVIVLTGAFTLRRKKSTQ